VIAGEEDMTLEGREVKQCDLFDQLVSVPERYRTVLEIVRATGGSERMTIKEWNNIHGHAATIANQLGFKGTTYTGNAHSAPKRQPTRRFAPAHQGKKTPTTDKR